MISDYEISEVLGKALELGADFAELFFEDSQDVTINFSGHIDEVSTMRSYGVGIYMMCGKKKVYVSTNDISKSSLMDAVGKASELLRLNGEKRASLIQRKKIVLPNPCPVEIYPSTVGFEDKISILKDADLFVRNLTPSVRNLKITYFDKDQKIRIVNTEGTDAEDRRVTSRIRFIPLLSNEHGEESHFIDYCAPAGFEALKDGAYTLSIKKQILDMEGSLSADEAPSAKVPVIFEGGDCTGTFFHEACGHQLETTSLLTDGLFWDKRGEKIASSKVTLVDDGTMQGMYGSGSIDDEGMERKKNILIKDGILKGYLADRHGARILGIPRTGSGRRQNYSYAPASRMSNTYLAAGNDDDDAIIRDTKEGLYVTGMGGGTGGREFTLMASVAYWIKNGKIDRRVKGAMLVGRGDETMLKIDRVGKIMISEKGSGSFCGAPSGFCATTTSGPRMRVSEMVVGGRGGKS